MVKFHIWTDGKHITFEVRERDVIDLYYLLRRLDVVVAYERGC